MQKLRDNRWLIAQNNVSKMQGAINAVPAGDDGGGWNEPDWQDAARGDAF